MLGGLVFAGYSWLGDDRIDGTEIVVTAGQQQSLVETFERTWRRSPSPEERASLMEDFVREELAYRQGMAMELDRDDIVIKRRLRQKLETLTQDMATLAPPSEAEQESYFANNAEAYRIEAHYTFEQIFFSTVSRGDRAERDARAVLTELRSESTGRDPRAAGDRTMLPAQTREAPQSRIAATFGERFAEQLAAIEPGQWSDPLRSSFGVHLVRITDRVASSIPPFADVADEVRAEIQSRRRQDAIDALYEGLRKNYTIRIEATTPEQAERIETGAIDQGSL